MKIEFFVIVGNPVEKMYDRFVKKHGGRITGIRKKSVKIWTGEYCDEKLYEILKDDFKK